MKTYRVAIVGLGRMASTIDEEVVGYPSITLPYSISKSRRLSNFNSRLGRIFSPKNARRLPNDGV